MLTAIGRAALVSREAMKLRAYRDSVGVWTIGVGHAFGDPVVTPGMVITEAEALEIFARDLRKYEDAVDRGVKVPLADHERDALVSICFNIGIGIANPKKGQKPGFLGSSFLKRLNEGDRAGCAKAIMSWVKPPEVTSRRTAERDQFLTPYEVALPKARSTDRGPVKVGDAPKASPIAKKAPTARPAAAVVELPEFTVRAIQRRLIALGYHDVGLVDGKIGPKFENALRQLQQRASDMGERVSVDGRYGPQTQGLLDEAKGDQFRNVISPERANIRARDLAAIGNPVVVQGRRIRWASLFGAVSALVGASYSAWQAPAELPPGSSIALAFLPPWVAAVAPYLITFLPLAYNALAGAGIVGTEVERTREGIVNSPAPPAKGPGGIFGQLFG